MRTRGSALWLAGVLSLSLVSGAVANGYKILCMRSAKAAAMGEAFIVQADDPSAIAYNPAGLAQLRSNQLNVHATIANAYTEHTAPSGVETGMEDRRQAVPSVFLTSDLGRENMTMGIGISYPNGLSSEWAENSFARYVATYSDLSVMDINPALGFRIGKNLLVGAGLNLYVSDVRLERMVDAGILMGSVPNGMDVQNRMDGDGTAWGANAGVICRLNSRHGLAATYRLPWTIDYDGHSTTAGIRLDAEASMDYPASAALGYAYTPTKRLKIEVNLDWTDWSEVDDVVLDIKAPGVSDMVLAQKFEDTVAWKVGTEYRCSDALSLRGGYIYNENATTEETWRPSLPDTDMHFLAGGFGYTTGAITVDAALQLVLYESRTINNNVDFNEFASVSSIDGEYRTWAPAVSLAMTYQF